MNTIRAVGIDFAKSVFQVCIIPVGILRFQQQLPELIEDASNSLPLTLRRLLSSL
ncbi:hypothetical protein [Kluyvera georgiana]|uniref:hypothetical protein n=1 Tax=Enterobacteriaceae TaxID=543 RepID=UPI00321FEE8F